MTRRDFYRRDDRQDDGEGDGNAGRYFNHGRGSGGRGASGSGGRGRQNSFNRNHRHGNKRCEDDECHDCTIPKWQETNDEEPNEDTLKQLLMAKEQLSILTSKIEEMSEEMQRMRIRGFGAAASQNDAAKSTDGNVAPSEEKQKERRDEGDGKKNDAGSADAGDKKEMSAGGGGGGGGDDDDDDDPSGGSGDASHFPIGPPVPSRNLGDNKVKVFPSMDEPDYTIYELQHATNGLVCGGTMNQSHYKHILKLTESIKLDGCPKGQDEFLHFKKQINKYMDIVGASITADVTIYTLVSVFMLCTQKFHHTLKKLAEKKSYYVSFRHFIREFIAEMWPNARDRAMFLANSITQGQKKLEYYFEDFVAVFEEFGGDMTDYISRFIDGITDARLREKVRCNDYGPDKTLKKVRDYAVKTWQAMEAEEHCRKQYQSFPSGYQRGRRAGRWQRGRGSFRGRGFPRRARGGASSSQRQNSIAAFGASQSRGRGVNRGRGGGAAARSASRRGGRQANARPSRTNSRGPRTNSANGQ